MWGTLGYVYNPKYVSREDAEDWGLLLNQKYYKQITAKDSVRDCYFAVRGMQTQKEILTKKFTNPEYFNPNRSFYDSVGITQKRWWDLYYGRKPISDNEYKKLSSHFGIELDDIIMNEQLNLFDNADSSGDN